MQEQRKWGYRKQGRQYCLCLKDYGKIFSDERNYIVYKEKE